MSTEEFIIALFDRVDDAMRDLIKHPQASLYPSELVTLALLYALKGDGPRAFYRWLARDYRPSSPPCPNAPASSAFSSPIASGPPVSSPIPPCSASPTPTASS